MNIRLQPEEEAQLAKIAVQRGLTREELAEQIICHYLEEAKGSIADTKADDRGGLGTELAALFSKHGLDVALESPFDPQPVAGLRPADSRGRLPRKSSRKTSRSRRKKRA